MKKTPFKASLALASIGLGFIFWLAGDRFYRFQRAVFQWTFKSFFGLKTIGENYLRPSKAILAGSHSGLLDGPLLQTVSLAPIQFLIAEEIYQWPVVGAILKCAGFITIVKGKGGEAIPKAINSLAQGRVICIFPEGKLPQDSDALLQPFQNGVFKIHEGSKAPVIPFTIHGGFEAWRKGQKKLSLVPITLQFGEPIEYRGLSEEEFLEQLQEKIQTMKNEFKKSNPQTLNCKS